MQLTNYKSQYPQVSPDGKLIACDFLDDREGEPRWRIGVLSVEGGAPVKVFDLPPQASHRIHWAHDGRALLYVETRDGVSNIWSQPLEGGKAVRLTDFKSELIYKFDVSYDGKQIALARGDQYQDIVLIKDFR